MNALKHFRLLAAAIAAATVCFSPCAQALDAELENIRLGLILALQSECGDQHGEFHQIMLPDGAGYAWQCLDAMGVWQYGGGDEKGFARHQIQTFGERYKLPTANELMARLLDNCTKRQEGTVTLDSNRPLRVSCSSAGVLTVAEIYPEPHAVDLRVEWIKQ